jgi:hypothetical protein
VEEYALQASSYACLHGLFFDLSNGGNLVSVTVKTTVCRQWLGSRGNDTYETIELLLEMWSFCVVRADVL